MAPRLHLLPRRSSDPPPPPPLSPEQRALVEMGAPMVARCATEIARRYPDLLSREELLSIGTIALDEAARSYQKERHPSFLHFARHHVRGRMLDNLRTEHFSLRARVEHSMERAFDRVTAHQTLGVDLFAGSEEELIEGARRGLAEEMAATFLAAHAAEPGATPEEELIELEGRRHQIEAVRSALATLPPEEQRVIDLVYRENKTLAEVARETGVHPNTAWKRHVSALRTLRAKLTREPSRRHT